MRRSIPPIALCLALLAGGCAQVGSLQAELSGERTYQTVSDRFIAVAHERRVPDAANSDLVKLASVVSGKPAAPSRGIDGRDPLPPGTKELPGTEPLQRYAERILNRLLENWPHAKPTVRIVVTNNPAYVAEAIPVGTILLSQGVFINATSEEELAFLLAHEVSHLLLNHLDSDRVSNAQKTLEDTSAGGLLTAAPRSNPQFARNAMLIYMSYQLIQEYVVNPSWTRKQEDEADLLGLDLLEKANYNINGFETVMQRFSDDAVKQQAKAEEERKRFDKQIEALVASGQVGAGIDAAFKKLGEGPGMILGEIGKRLKSGHNSAERRIEDLKTYVGRSNLIEASARPTAVEAYEKAVFRGPALKVLARSVLTQRADSLINDDRLDEAEAILKDAAKGGFDSDPQLRMSYYRLHAKQGRFDLAIRDLEIVVRSSSAPKEAFDFLIAEYRNSGQISSALGTLDQKERRFGGAEQNYPMRIRLLIEGGRRPEAGMVYERCRALRNPIVQECNSVWGESVKI